jgi:hypothetical protein
MLAEMRIWSAWYGRVRSFKALARPRDQVPRIGEPGVLGEADGEGDWLAIAAGQ